MIRRCALWKVWMMTCFSWLVVVGFFWQTTAMAQDSASRAEKLRQAIYEAAQSVPSPELVGRQPEKDLEALELIDPLKQQLADLEKEFAAEIATNNQPFRNLGTTITYVRQRLDAFTGSLSNFASLEMVQDDVAHVRKMLAMAVENQAPAYFQPTSDIANRSRLIETRIKALEKIGAVSKQLETAKKFAQDLRGEVAVAQKKLLQQIISSNQIPTDNYRKPDREELLKLIQEAWEKAAPSVKPLKIGLIGGEWQRDKKWEIQNRTLYEVDRSRIQGFVVVPHDNQTVACRRILISRDHVDHEKTTARLFNNPKDPPEPLELLLKSKLQ